MWVHFKHILRYLDSKLDKIWPNAQKFSKWEDDQKRCEEITEIYGLFDDDYAFNFMKKSGNGIFVAGSPTLEKFQV